MGRGRGANEIDDFEVVPEALIEQGILDPPSSQLLNSQSLLAETLDKLDAEGASIIVMLDRSGSSFAPRISNWQKEMVENLLTANEGHLTKIAVYGYASSSSPARFYEFKALESPFSKLTISHIPTSGGGGTPTGKAILFATRKLEGSPARKIILLVTDGKPDKIEEVKRRMQDAVSEGIEVFVLAQLSSYEDDIADIFGRERFEVAPNNNFEALPLAVSRLDALKELPLAEDNYGHPAPTWKPEESVKEIYPGRLDGHGLVAAEPKEETPRFRAGKEEITLPGTQTPAWIISTREESDRAIVVDEQGATHAISLEEARSAQTKRLSAVSEPVSAPMRFPFQRLPINDPSLARNVRLPREKVRFPHGVEYKLFGHPLDDAWDGVSPVDQVGFLSHETENGNAVIVDERGFTWELNLQAARDAYATKPDTFLAEEPESEESDSPEEDENEDAPDFYGKKVVLTGNFKPLRRGEVEATLRTHGAYIAQYLGRERVDYLIVGDISGARGGTTNKFNSASRLGIEKLYWDEIKSSLLSSY
jgi:hypothetical protein